MVFGHFGIAENIHNGSWIEPCFSPSWDSSLLSGPQDSGIGYGIQIFVVGFSKVFNHVLVAENGGCGFVIQQYPIFHVFCLI
jgi:hypothetical protein